MVKSSLKISVFYRQDSWQELLRSECISRFISRHRAEGRPFQIDFGSVQGQNISIGFNPRSEKEIQEFVGELKSFVKSNPSVNTGNKFPVDGFFMDFPNNAVFSGGGSLDVNRAKLIDQVSYLEIKTKVSALIVEKLAEDKVDEDNIFSFLLALQFRLAEALFPARKEAKVKIRTVVNILSQRLHVEAQVKIDEQLMDIFLDNIDEFRDMGGVMWHKKPSEDMWLDSWEKTCKEVVSEQTDRVALFLKISTLIFEQVNVVDNYKLLLSCKLLYNVLVLK